MPSDAELPNPMHREVARVYSERREFPVEEVLEAVALFAQPELLDTSTQQLTIVEFESARPSNTSTMLAPIPRISE